MRPCAPDLGEVADSTQKAVGDARGSAAAHGDFGGAVLVDFDVHDVGGAGDDEAEVFVGIELEAEEDAEAGAERRAERRPGRVAAATKVKGRISMTWVRAAGPWPMMMSSL